MVSFPDPRARPPYHMHDMIRAQPGFVAEALRRAEAFEAPAWLRRARRIVATGCGTSFHAATYAAAVLREALPGRDVRAVHAHDLLFGPPVPGGVTVVGVSHSGNTPTTNRALARARRSGARVLAVVGLPESPMDRVAHRSLVLGRTHDRSWANTMSYTTQLAGLATLARACGDGSEPGVAGGISRIPSAIERALRVEPAVRRLARRVAARSRVTFLATGLDEITAREAALKIRETCSLPASAYHTEQALHGPFLSLDGREAVVALRSRDDRWRADAILDAFASAAGFVARIGDGAGVSIRLPRVHRILRPIVSIVPMQFLAYHAALARKADPDIMRTDVGRYAAGLEELFTWRPARGSSGRRSRPRRRSGG